MSFLTCFSDASLCSRSLACGWGGWAIREEWGRGRFYGGVSMLGARNSNEAELVAVLHLLRALSAEGELATVSGVMIQSDSIAMLAALMALVPGAEWRASKSDLDMADVDVRRTFSPFERRHSQEIANLLYMRFVYVRHVKGHTDNAAGRSWVNAQCDREAKKHMQFRRKSASQVRWLDPV